MTLKTGPIEDVNYDEDGTVLDYWQSFLDADGIVIGRCNTETEKGRERRRLRAWTAMRKRQGYND